MEHFRIGSEVGTPQGPGKLVGIIGDEAKVLLVGGGIATVFAKDLFAPGDEPVIEVAEAVVEEVSVEVGGPVVEEARVTVSEPMIEEGVPAVAPLETSVEASVEPPTVPGKITRRWLREQNPAALRALLEQDTGLSAFRRKKIEDHLARMP